MNLDEAEISFQRWMDSATESWFQESDRVKGFVMEMMERRMVAGQSTKWKDFRSSNDWSILSRFFSSEQRFRFSQIWKECEGINANT